MKLYFAYGSNMNQVQMLDRCPGAILLGPAVLEGYRLAFTIFSPTRQCGCADVIPSEGNGVHGLVYELNDADAARMDEFEGVPIHYRRIPVEVFLNEKKMEAFTYEVVNKTEGLIPSADYLGLLKSAAESFQFPLKYREFLASFPTQ
jgi:gamma-glutamylcyclotransferase